MKLLIVENPQRAEDLDYHETQIVCASEDTTKLEEIFLKLVEECLDSKSEYWSNKEFGVSLQKDSGFSIIDLKVI